MTVKESCIFIVISVQSHRIWFHFRFVIQSVLLCLCWQELKKNNRKLLPAMLLLLLLSRLSPVQLCNPIDSSPPGSPIPGILQARTLEWVAISFNARKWKMKVKSLSRVRLLATPWTTAHQAPSSMWFSRQEYWSGVPLPSLLTLPYLSSNFCSQKQIVFTFSFI